MSSLELTTEAASAFFRLPDTPDLLQPYCAENNNQSSQWQPQETGIPQAVARLIFKHRRDWPHLFLLWAPTTMVADLSPMAPVILLGARQHCWEMTEETDDRVFKPSLSWKNPVHSDLPFTYRTLQVFQRNAATHLGVLHSDCTAPVSALASRHSCW